jgi:hypothetical protein
VSNKVTLLKAFSGLIGVAIFVQCPPGQTEEYEAKPTANEVWVRLEPGIL